MDVKKKISQLRAWEAANPHAKKARNHRSAMSGVMWISQKRRFCAKRDLPFDLHWHQGALAARIAAGRCELTGVKFDFEGFGCSGGARHKWNSPSIDRIEPAKGYVYSNIRVICYAANVGMSNFGEAAFTKMLAAIASRQ